ncbi:Nlp family transcriptional regulator [Methylomonas koyamae]|uniref:Nlp family transcriptional regulator n=2 Tax=Methylomonas koyamae TaxID=702114 RepID=A0A177NT51_9GAMM|nr:Nlp family transcriptional regulator [Methylomonas koyamae]
MNNSSPKKAQAKNDLHPADVVAALHKAGWTITALGKAHGLSSGQTLSKALSQSYPVAEKRIADALGVHPMEIWPSRYFENGDVKPRGFRAIQFNRITLSVNGKDQAGNSHEAA